MYSAKSNYETFQRKHRTTKDKSDAAVFSLDRAQQQYPSPMTSPSAQRAQATTTHHPPFGFTQRHFTFSGGVSLFRFLSSPSLENRFNKSVLVGVLLECVDALCRCVGKAATLELGNVVAPASAVKELCSKRALRPGSRRAHRRASSPMPAWSRTL